MKHLLVTGGAGFIGSNFVRYWLNNNPNDKVIVVDALTYAGNLQSLAEVQDHAGFRFEKIDIREEDKIRALLESEEIDWLVHFAAESHVDRSITGPDEFVHTNVNGTLSLLNAARKAWQMDNGIDETKRFHHVSTVEVYGTLEAHDPAFTEATPYSPNSPYAASKAASDHLVRAYLHTYGLPVTISNCSNNYGPFHFPEKLIPLIVVNALDGKSLPIYGDGSNIRDWLFVEDHCIAIDKILRDGAIGETYNVGGNSERNNLEIVKQLCVLIDAKFANDQTLAQRFPNAPAAQGRNTTELMTFVSDRPGHDWRYAINATKLEKDLGFSARTTFDEGLAQTVNWMLDNEPWWRSVMDGSYRDWVQKNYTTERAEGS